LINPRTLAVSLVANELVQSWAAIRTTPTNAVLGRTVYFDARPEEGEEDPERAEYWRAIETLEDVELGFGALRSLKRQPRQKGVDALIAVSMLVGAFSGLFDIAILVAADADFIPVVEEVRRRGVMVAVAARPSAQSLSDDLRRIADRFIDLDRSPGILLPMAGPDGKQWRVS
jgi:uncharacterized LabA/DUF88 family protein